MFSFKLMSVNGRGQVRSGQAKSGSIKFEASGCCLEIDRVKKSIPKRQNDKIEMRQTGKLKTPTSCQ